MPVCVAQPQGDNALDLYVLLLSFVMAALFHKHLLLKLTGKKHVMLFRFCKRKGL